MDDLTGPELALRVEPVDGSGVIDGQVPLEGTQVVVTPTHGELVAAVVKVSRQSSDAMNRLFPPWCKHLPVAIFATIYAIHFSMITVAMLHAYEQPAYDMAVPDQGIWLLSRFHDPFLTVAGRNLFGDHPSFIYLSLVPVFWVYLPYCSVACIQPAVDVDGLRGHTDLPARPLPAAQFVPGYLSRCCLSAQPGYCSRPILSSSMWRLLKLRC